jgi:hypothetical protein
VLLPRLSYTVLSILVLAVLMAGSCPAWAVSEEHQIKAAMIYNMVRFMEWPEEALSVAATQFRICTAGKGGLALAVEELRGKQLKGRIVTVQHVTTSAAGCQVLVLSEPDRSATADLLEKVRTSAVVTVAESAGFARSGGVVGFVLQGGKVRFEINQTAAQRHRIRISAQLLKLAHIVQEPP